MDRDRPLVTFAVICKNEAGNIERCLSSIIRETALLDTEILVVDSYSTDGTVEIARKFPVTIVQLGRDWQHSPAAGRYTGVLHARGRYLMLIDGDMELLPSFVAEALALMESDSSIVAIRGRLHNCQAIDGNIVYVNSEYDGKMVDRSEFRGNEVAHPTAVANGAALFRLQAVREAGNFHPFLKGEEEGEISRRLRARGGKLYYMPVDSVNHFGYLPDPLAEVGRRLRRGMIGAAGQMFRLSLEEGYALSYLRRIYQHLLLGFGFLMVVPALLLSLVYPIALLVWLSFHGLLLCAYWCKTGAFKPALAALVVKLLIGVDIIRGLFVPVPDRHSYPTDVIIIHGLIGGLNRSEKDS